MEEVKPDGERKYKILLVDDNADMREYIYHLICDQYQVKMVGDGEQALDAMKGSYRPDLILSDVMMPKLDGLGLLKVTLFSFSKVVLMFFRL